MTGRIEAGCNCHHLPDSARCVFCKHKHGPDLWATGSELEDHDPIFDVGRCD